MTRIERDILKASVSWTDKVLTVKEEKAFQAGAHWAFDTVFNWLRDNMDTRKTVMKDMLGNDMCIEYLTADFKSVDELIGNFKYDKSEIKE